MPVHSLHIFDRKGKTLFTKRFVKEGSDINEKNLTSEQMAEQRKLVFGMLFSLGEVATSLSPTPSSSKKTQPKDGLHSVRTGATTLYHFETNSGLRFALYVANHALTNDATAEDARKLAALPDTSVRAALEYIYNELWIQCVTRSPLYRPTEPTSVEDTNFEVKLTSFLRAQPWFR